MTEFLYMGGYAFYVWTSFALAIVILLFNVIAPSMKHGRNLRQASDLYLLNRIDSDDT